MHAEPSKDRVPKVMRVLAFFARNESEILTSEDISDKFGIPRRAVSTYMRGLKRYGLVEVRDMPKGGRGCGGTWYAGPALLEVINVRGVKAL